MSDKLKTVGTQLVAQAARVAEYVPTHFKGYDPERNIRNFNLAAMKTPDLLECSLASIFVSYCHAAAMGLEIENGLGHGYLAPFNKNIGTRDNPRWAKECQFIPGYRGLAYAAIRSAVAIDVDGIAVFKKDAFSWREGSDPRIDHTPSLELDPGELVAAYARFVLPDGRVKQHVMPRWAIDKVKAASQTGRKDKGPWRDWFEAMAAKSPIKRGAKLLPISSEDRRALTFMRTLAADDALEAGDASARVSTILGVKHEDPHGEPIRQPTSGDILDAALGLPAPAGDDEVFDPAKSAELDREQAGAS